MRVIDITSLVFGSRICHYSRLGTDMFLLWGHWNCVYTGDVHGQMVVFLFCLALPWPRPSSIQCRLWLITMLRFCV